MTECEYEMDGIALLIRTLTPWFAIPVFVVLMDRVFIRVSEQMLGARFGATWQAYKAKVRRWI